MKNSRTIPCRLRAVFIALIFSAALLLRGAEPAKAVIGTSTVNVGTHSVTIQRVVPPASDAAAAAAPVASIGNRSGSPRGSASSGAVVAGQQAGEASTASRSYGAPAAALARVRQEILSLSCTLYDGAVTEVRWQSASGGDYRILSSIDFNYLRNTGAFAEGERSYTVFMGLGAATITSRAAAGNALPTVLPAAPNARFTIAPAPVSAETLESLQMPGNAGYIILASPAQTEADAFRGIDALHRYYDAHKEELIATWQQMEAERIAREQYEKEHPPVPKDTLIQFWPKKNSRYLNAATTATGAAAIDSSHGVPGLLSGDAATATETTGGKEAK